MIGESLGGKPYLPNHHRLHHCITHIQKLPVCKKRYASTSGLGSRESVNEYTLAFWAQKEVVSSAVDDNSTQALIG